MEISNKTLGLLLIAAIVVSLGGTIVSLNKLDATSTTGYVTNNQTGNVSLSVGAALSIIISGDAEIAFGECTPDVNSALILDSNASASGANNSACSGGTFPDNITIVNDGNVNANVTIRTSANGTTLFDGDTNGGFAYMARNAVETGCANGLQDSYVEFTVEDDGIASDTDLNPLCGNLSYADAGDEIQVFARITLPASVDTTTGSADITFEATQAI
jgi:hypothetical protein